MNISDLGPFVDDLEHELALRLPNRGVERLSEKSGMREAVVFAAGLYELRVDVIPGSILRTWVNLRNNTERAHPVALTTWIRGRGDGWERRIDKRHLSQAETLREISQMLVQAVSKKLTTKIEYAWM